MVPPTRRRLLRTAAAATAVGLAGCNGSVGERSGTSRSVSENADSTIPGGTTEHDPEMLLVRAGTDELPVRIDGDGGTPESHDPQPSRLSYAVIDTRSRAERLVAADGVDADAVTAFGSATAFDSEALYLETRRVEECFRLRLCGISWTTEQIRTAYARELRPYDERCSAGESVFESRLIRLPAALDRREANVVDVAIDGGGTYTVEVSLYHDDDGEEGYADWWQVERLDGTRLGRRKLRHAHSRQPFTRSEIIDVPAGVDCVVVRGHDRTHGYGGVAALLDVESGAYRTVEQGSERRSFDTVDCL